MPYSILKSPSNKFKVQFRSRYIKGSINRTLLTKNETLNLGEKLDANLDKLLNDKKAIHAHLSQTLLDSDLAGSIYRRKHRQEENVDQSPFLDGLERNLCRCKVLGTRSVTENPECWQGNGK
jgi:hypothetical protein